MYGLMGAFEPTRATLVAGGRNEGLSFGNVVANSETIGDGDHGGGGSISRNMELWHCGGEHLKRNCPKCAEKNKNKNDDGGADNKRAEVKGGQLHTMFTSLVDVQSATDFSELGEDKEFTWHKFHVEVWGARYFEGHARVDM